MDLMSLLIQIIVGIVVLAPVLWISGRLLAGKDKAKITDAIWIVVLGVVIGAIVGYFIYGLVSWIIMLIVWLALVKHFFDCGWLKAFAISIIAVLIFIVIAVVIALILGIALVGLLGLAI
jgi:cation transport ATPase